MRWLLDEMLPRAAVDALNERGHDAVSVVDIDLRTASDDSVYATAVEQARIVVTEDENDCERILKQAFATGDAVVPVDVVRKARLGRGGAAAQCPTGWPMPSTAGPSRIPNPSSVLTIWMHAAIS